MQMNFIGFLARNATAATGLGPLPFFRNFLITVAAFPGVVVIRLTVALLISQGINPALFGNALGEINLIGHGIPPTPSTTPRYPDTTGRADLS
jgi:hypothetical protein